MLNYIFANGFVGDGVIGIIASTRSICARFKLLCFFGFILLSISQIMQCTSARPLQSPLTVNTEKPKQSPVFREGFGIWQLQTVVRANGKVTQWGLTQRRPGILFYYSLWLFFFFNHLYSSQLKDRSSLGTLQCVGPRPPDNNHSMS